MKKALFILGIFFLLGCPNSEVTRSNYKGQVFKGPFLVGSTVTIYELDSNLVQTGRAFSSTVISDDGKFDISSVPVSGNVELVANGFFFDEITGEITGDRMTMRTITNQSGVVNINLFSVLQYDRVKKLYADGKTLNEAKTESITELLNIFGFQNLDQSADSISMSSANAPALLAISSMFTNSELQQNRSRKIQEIEELITLFRVDFQDGLVSSTIIERLKKSAIYVIPAEVRSNLQTYFNSKNIDVVVPAFSDAMNDFITIGIKSGEYKIILDSIELLTKTSGIIIPEGNGYTIQLVNNSNSTITMTIVGISENLRYFLVGGVKSQQIIISGDGFKEFSFYGSLDKYLPEGESLDGRNYQLIINDYKGERTLNVFEPDGTD